MSLPESYKVQDGCWNCATGMALFLDHKKPFRNHMVICLAASCRGEAQPHGICEHHEKEDEHPLGHDDPAVYGTCEACGQYGLLIAHCICGHPKADHRDGDHQCNACEAEGKKCECYCGISKATIVVLHAHLRDARKKEDEG